MNFIIEQLKSLTIGLVILGCLGIVAFVIPYLFKHHIGWLLSGVCPILAWILGIMWQKSWDGW